MIGPRNRDLEQLQSGDPRRIGDCYVEGRIPGAHRSRVYLARALSGELCVIKMPPADRLGPDDLRRFLREASNARRVQSHRVARVQATERWNGVPFIRQEFVDAPSLQEVLEESPDHRLSDAELTRLATGLLLAIRDCHRADVIHRDLKPGNVLLHRERGVVLVDFGIALRLADPRITEEFVVPGSPWFVSPEQVTGRGVEKASDLFLWGLVVATAAGRHPYADRTDWMHAVAYEEPSIPDSIPEPLAGWVRGSLSRRPAWRPAIDDVLDDLSRMEQPPVEPTMEYVPVPGPTMRDLTDRAELRRTTRRLSRSLEARLTKGWHSWVAALLIAVAAGTVVGAVLGVLAAAVRGLVS